VVAGLLVSECFLIRPLVARIVQNGMAAATCKRPGLQCGLGGWIASLPVLAKPAVSGPVKTGENMLANFSRVNESADVDELVFFLRHVKEASRNFADLGDWFRKATSRNITPSVLKHDVNTVFAVQAGDLLCQCWRRGMLSVYRPHFYFPSEDEPRIRYVFSWFTFIRDDWKSEFAPEMDQLKGLDHPSQRDYQSAATDDVNDLVVWRLNLQADVQATACDILADELGQLAEAVEKRLRQLYADLAELQRQEGKPTDTAGEPQPPADTDSAAEHRGDDDHEQDSGGQLVTLLQAAEPSSKENSTVVPEDQRDGLSEIPTTDEALASNRQGRDKDKEARLDEIEAMLTGKSYLLFCALRKRKHYVEIATLNDEVYEGRIKDSSVKTALERLNVNLEETEYAVSFDNCRAKLSDI
jgi:hypothetical protein